MDINLRCAFHMTLIFHKYLELSKGCIVNVSCALGSRPNAGTIGYCMTKAGLEMLTKCSALELAPFGIRVNAVSPATIDTNLYRYTGMSEVEYQNFKKRAATNIPLQRIASVEEVAKSVIYLTSEQCLKVTGHILKVDGGKTLTSSGYMPWYGIEMMNRRFEPDFMSNVNYWMQKGKEKVTKSRHVPGSDEWVSEI
jgi:NAD(P)-dependent dehydrogenase (short-subunit alcohol dehydrogenase family)